MKKKPIKTKFFFITIALLFATPAWAEEVLYCQSELGTMLMKIDGKWKSYNRAERRYTLKFNDDYSVISGFCSAVADKRCK